MQYTHKRREDDTKNRGVEFGREECSIQMGMQAVLIPNENDAYIIFGHMNNGYTYIYLDIESYNKRADETEAACVSSFISLTLSQCTYSIRCCLDDEGNRTTEMA